MSQTNPALVVGGTRGIGAAIAQSLSEQYQVLAPGSSAMDVTNIEAILKYFSQNDLYFDTQAIQKSFQLNNSPQAGKQKISALIYNAGLHFDSPSHKATWQDITQLLDTNLLGALRLTQVSIPAMLEKQAGKIIFISSLSGQNGEAYASAYAASKAALLGLNKSLALEYGSQNIQVNAICPGWVRTEMAQKQLNTPEQELANLGATLQNRWIEPEEIAHTVQYLLSP